MLIPKLPSLFKNPIHRHFDYKPLYYNERKERLDQLKEVHSGSENSGRRTSIKFYSSRGKSYLYSNLRLIAIIFALLLLAYLIIVF
jgi:hypothetical protein